MMEELKSQPYGVSAADVGKPAVDKSGKHVFVTPVWVTVVRGFQIFFGFVILILAGILIHGLAMDAICFALACGLFTWIVSFYAVLTEKVQSWQKAYNHWAVLSLDIFMTILWLSSMGAVAALRSGFKYDVDADCWDDGSAVNAGHCVVYKRSLNKRFAVASQAGLASMSAIAGLSALEMLLFIATLAYLAHQIRLRYRSEKSSDPATVEMNAQQQQPMLSQHAPASAPASAYTDQAAYQNTQYTGAQGQQGQYISQPAQLYDGYGYPPQQQQQQQQQQHQQPYQYPQEVPAHPQGYGQSPVAYTPSASPAPTYTTNQAYPQVYQPPQQ